MIAFMFLSSGCCWLDVIAVAPALRTLSQLASADAVAKDAGEGGPSGISDGCIFPLPFGGTVAICSGAAFLLRLDRLRGDCLRLGDFGHGYCAWSH